MKKTFSFSLMAVAFIATLILAGCQKDANILRVRIDNFGGNGKVYIGGTNSNVPTWNSGDIIWIDHCDASNPNNHSYTLNEFNSRGEALLTLPNYPSYCALYPYDLGTVAEGTTTASITIPQVQRYYVDDNNNKQVVNAPMAACTLNDPNGSISFHNLGALLAITIECNILTHASMDVWEVRVTSASGYPLFGSTTVDISNPNAIFDFRSATSAYPSPDSTIYLRKFNSSNQQVKLFTLDTTTNKKKTVYVSVPAIPSGVNNRYTIEVVARNGSTDISKTRHQVSNTGGNLPRNTMANVEFPMRDLVAPTGAVPDGRFTIDAAGHQVYFASGNLQYNRSTNTWRIAEHQWDKIGGGSFGGNVSGSSNENISNASYLGWIDLFGWATSGYHNSADNGNIRYMPYDYLGDESTVDATHNYYGYGPSIDVDNSAYINGVNANYDWGVYHSNVAANDGHAIMQYGGEPVTRGASWRTLTGTEWSYLLKTRVVNGATGIHHTWSGVTCNGVLGILIYPDGYTDQLTSSSNLHAVISTVPSRCVFLPLAGHRRLGTMNTTAQGFYWSSQCSTGEQGKKAQYLNFNVKNNGTTPSITVPSSNNRFYGFAVRLVTPVI